MTRARLGLAAALAAACAAGEAAARDQIRIVGSSTVFPFTTTVAERFGKASGKPTPVVEANGTGGGLKLFCAGVGAGHPDAANASRRMKKSEFEDCAKNGVTDILEIMIGYDGVAIANAKDAPAFDLTVADLYKALGKSQPLAGKLEPNKLAKWSDVSPSLPSEKIEVIGPPPTSGTRDSFAELGLEAGCKALPGAKDLGLEGKACQEIRADGVWTDGGENDNVIVSKLVANHGAVGVFGYSFLEENADKLKGARLNGVEPTAETIADGSYPLSRSMYVYVKKAHIGAIPGLAEFVKEYVSEEALGEDGYLADKGLIPPTAEKLEADRAVLEKGELLTVEGLH